MRLLVHADSLVAHPRVVVAACGLALRGHEVGWLGGGFPEPLAGVMSRVTSASAAGPVDIVIGASETLCRVAWAGWLAGAHAAVIEAATGETPGLVGRIAWGMLDGIRFEPGAVAPVATHDESGEHDRSESWDAIEPPAAPHAAHPDVERLERACERLVARRHTRGTRPAVFLDRDGTLVVEREYLSDPEGIEILPGVAEALRALHAAGYVLVVVSNQSGVGRGLFPADRVHAAMAQMRRLLRHEGVELDAVYFCPHRPEDACACRKPAPELLQRAARNLGLSLRESAMVGDKSLDVETGHRAGARGVLVRTGHGRAEEVAFAGADRRPDAVAEDLGAAVPWLLDHRSEAAG